MIFFGYLQSQLPHLLEFKTSGDGRQTVHGWLTREFGQSPLTMPTPILRKPNPVLLGYAGAGHPFPAASAQALVSGMSKRVRANVPAPKEEHFMSDERDDQERPCLHCMIVELIDDFLTSIRRQPASQTRLILTK